MSVSRSLGALARSRFATMPRALIGRLLGGRLRTVRVLSGLARGARLELDLAFEKAYWLGHHEPETQDYLRKHVSRGDVVYDVGAHIGFFSVCAARLGAVVYAFEPDPANAQRVRRQAELNGLRIHVVQAAVWDSCTGVTLFGGDSSSEWRAREQGSVPSVTLDAFAVEHESPVLVKIDAEGAEGRVLRGAAELLRTRRPAILCECHGEESRNEVAGLLDGYDIQLLEGPWRIGATKQLR
jgi:FkbM family methyltransferase